MKPRNPPLQSLRMLDQVRERIRYFRFYVRWHGRNGKMTHKCDMGAKQVKAF